MNIGKLRDIIHFGLMQETSDGMGGITTEFVEVASAYGRIIPSASETSLDGDVRNVYSYSFESRFVSGIKPNMVIKLNDESYIWKIKDVIDPSGKGERLSFTAVRDVENAVLPPPTPPTPPEPDDGDDEEEEDGD